MSHIPSITNLYISSIPKNLHVPWWKISYIQSILTWIRYTVNIHEKTPMLESLFNKMAGLRSAASWKKRLRQSCFPKNFVKF